MQSSMQDEAYDRLPSAGWSLGVYSVAGSRGVTCIVEGVNGENMIRGEGATSDAVFQSACDQARAVGLLGRQQERQGTRRR
jgi:hypothetical protein